MSSATRLSPLVGVPILYTVVLLVATHWPSDEMPASLTVSDKILHFGAYLVWALLALATLSRDAGTRTVGLVAGAGVAIAILDEVTQPLPGINRSADFFDFVADVIGIATGVCLWAVWRRLRRRPATGAQSVTPNSQDGS